MKTLSKFFWILALVAMLFDLGALFNPYLDLKEKQTYAFLGLIQCVIMWYTFDAAWKNDNKKEKKEKENESD